MSYNIPENAPNSLPPTILLWYSMVWLWGGVLTFENEIGDVPLTFILILWDLLLPSTFSSSNLLQLLLIPPSYFNLLPNLLLTPPTSS